MKVPGREKMLGAKVFRVDDETIEAGGAAGSYQSDLEVACLRSRGWMGIRRSPLPQKASKIEAGAIACARELERNRRNNYRPGDRRAGVCTGMQFCPELPYL